MSEFVKRKYTKLELARLYWPDTPTDASAVEMLRRDIHRCRPLCEELRKLPAYNVNDKHFSKVQVELIVYYLGEP
jgi:hypothetical protein